MEKLKNQSFTMKFHLKNVRKRPTEVDDEFMGDMEYLYKADIYIEYGNRHFLLGSTTDEEENIRAFIDSTKDVLCGFLELKKGRRLR